MRSFPFRSVNAQRAEIRRVLFNPKIQAKLHVSEPDDIYEREADRVANEVMRIPESEIKSEPIRPNWRSHVHAEEEGIAIRAKMVEGKGTELNPDFESRILSLRFVHNFSRIPMFSPSSIQVQPKQAVCLPRDRYEREADRFAKQVMGMAHTPIRSRRQVSENEAQVQAKCEECQEGKQTQRSAAGAASEIQSDMVRRLKAGESSGRSLPVEVQSFMEPRFGTDFSQVKMHTDSEAAQMNRELQAKAFTYRQHIYFGPGKSPGVNDLTAHELTHVVQQANTPQGRPSPINATIQRMLACPSTLATDDPAPRGWKPYQGDSSVFHCGFRGILEDRAPTAYDLQNECFYDHSGVLVTASHPYAGCRGTPNRHDSRFLFGVPHATVDPGGIVRAGAPAFITSRVYYLDRAISSAIRVVSTAGRICESVYSALGDAIAICVLTAIATVDLGNWRFQELPARSVRHLNVMGAILSSTTLAQNAETGLRNLTHRLDSFSITGLLDELAQDINQALQASGLAQRVSSAILGELSLLQLVGWLNENGIVQYIRPPEDIAREQLTAQRTP